MRTTPWPRLLFVAGALIVLASAVSGWLSLNRMPDLSPVSFGEQVEIAASEPATATIFVSTGLARAPACQVTAGDGNRVTAGEAERYQQRGGLESAFGFPLSAGATYAVTCGRATDSGRFAVARDADVPEEAFIAAGPLGALTCGSGLVLVVRERRARRAVLG